ncbi:MAG: hypothetical protein JWO38_7010 [Gemmataceae bacterium]|nr:hypothetical protein [Gemmataceae bacterium]
MPTLREIEERVLANGRVDGQELEVLRQAVYVKGTVSREAADFLVEIRKRVLSRTPGFEKFFFKAIRDHVLADGRISRGEAAWLREALLADGKLDDAGRKFLHQLRGEAKEVSPEFESLLLEFVE